MADFHLSGEVFSQLIDLIADNGAEYPELDAVMATFDEIQHETSQGRTVLIAVEPFTIR